jgi:protein involved in polysaccharide export with SLBB domain
MLSIRRIRMIDPVVGLATDSIRSTIAIFLGLIALTISGCGASARDVEASSSATPATSVASSQPCVPGTAATQTASAGNDRYFIQPGDQLAISFYLSPEFDDTVTVRPDGNVSLKLVGDLRAAGRTPGQLAAGIDELYLQELRNPVASVHVKSSPSRQIYVEGEVAKPGAIALEPGMTALQAIAGAGGLMPTANDTAILIRRDGCGPPHKEKLNLSAAVNSGNPEEDAALMPRDIVVVPRSGIANVDVWVDQHIRKLIPVDYIPIF